jgi:hypothetical protein
MQFEYIQQHYPFRFPKKLLVDVDENLKQGYNYSFEYDHFHYKIKNEKKYCNDIIIYISDLSQLIEVWVNEAKDYHAFSDGGLYRIYYYRIGINKPFAKGSYDTYYENSGKLKFLNII